MRQRPACPAAVRRAARSMVPQVRLCFAGTRHRVMRFHALISQVRTRSTASPFGYCLLAGHGTIITLQPFCNSKQMVKFPSDNLSTFNHQLSTMSSVVLLTKEDRSPPCNLAEVSNHSSLQQV